jgi:Ca2+-binding EF-hand superfamily protein
MVMSLGKVDTHALSETILYMEHHDSALNDVAQLLITRMGKSNETIEDVFYHWDTSGDGELSFKELQKAMEESNMHMQSARFRAMWRKIDIDSSGGITMDEFRVQPSSYAVRCLHHNSCVHTCLISSP